MPCYLFSVYILCAKNECSFSLYHDVANKKFHLKVYTYVAWHNRMTVMARAGLGIRTPRHQRRLFWARWRAQRQGLGRRFLFIGSAAAPLGALLSLLNRSRLVTRCLTSPPRQTYFLLPIFDDSFCFHDKTLAIRHKRKNGIQIHIGHVPL